jgi:hypothetical protein
MHFPYLSCVMHIPPFSVNLAIYGQEIIMHFFTYSCNMICTVKRVRLSFSVKCNLCNYYFFLLLLSFTYLNVRNVKWLFVKFYFFIESTVLFPFINMLMLESSFSIFLS